MDLKLKFKRLLSGALSLVVIATVLPSIPAAAEEPEKYPYSIFGRNGIVMTANNLCMNGNVHTNKDADITSVGGNINGKITTGNDIEKRIKHVYADQKIMETYFTENCDLYEEEYVYSDMNIHINNPIFCYNNISLDGNVALNSNLGSLMNINITGEVKNANTSVVYSKYGDITIENDSTANINGLIYAPLGTLTINSPNINLNGVIIADRIVINGGSANINYKDDIARFIGTTSEVYDFSGLEYLPEEWLGDSDEDDLFDIYEKVIDTDPFDSDTDDDGLPDGYEVLTLNTDPLEVDTDENGITDADEDFDSDNLSNLGEYQYETSPFDPDTDEDGFMDGDEVYTYGTEPLNPDTDNDGLLDGEESYDGSIYVKYGVYFDPLNPDTNGNGILDGDELFVQSKQQEVETHDEAITEVNVDMNTNGSIERNLTIKSMYNVDAMSTNVYGMIGEPFNFTSSTDFESATITFKIDQSKLGDTLFDNLIILWYNEEEQIFEEMPTNRDAVNSTVSTTTTHFSQYMVVDSVKWYQNWNNSIAKFGEMWIGGTSYQKNLNTIFLIDCSASMKNDDPIDFSIEIGYNGVTEDNYQKIISDMDSPGDIAYYNENYGRRRCKRISICENIINNMGSDDSGAVITFSSGVETNSGFFYNHSYLKTKLQKVNNNGSTAYLNSAINTALTYVESNSTDMYRLVVITNDDITFGTISSADFGSNTMLNIVNLGSTAIGNNIETVARATGGDVYDAISVSDLTYESGEMIYGPPQFIGEDTDGDGIPDIVEEYGLKPNGQPIGTDPKKRDTDGDGIDDNIELGYIPGVLDSNVTIADYVKSLKLHSDPTKIDTDGDGINDNEDKEPLNVYLAELIKTIELMEKYIDELLPLYCDINSIPPSQAPSNSTIAINILRNYGYGTDEVEFSKDPIRDITQSMKWTITDGYYYPEFKTYINNKDSSILNYIRSYRLYDKDGQAVDFLHLLATLGAERLDFIDPNLAGWAGDLQSFIRDLKIVTYGQNLSLDEMKDKAYDIISNYSKYTQISYPKFPNPDLLSDLDAKNIRYRYDESDYLSFILKDYYNNHIDSRFEEFVANMGGEENLKKLVTEYTRGNGPVKHMILHHFAKEAADREDIQKIYHDSYVGSEVMGGVDSPIIEIYALNEPSIVTETESEALKYAFEHLIWDGLNEEKN